MYNARGNLLKQTEILNSDLKISLTDYPQGLYLIKIITNKGSFTKKVIVRR